MWRDVWQTAFSNEGMMFSNEAHCLYTLAKQCNIIVEIGAYKGCSTAMLAAGASPGAVLLSIDPHEGLGYVDPNRDEPTIQALWTTLGAVSLRKRVAIIPTTSQEALPLVLGILNSRPIDLLFIDGNHSFESVRQDLEMYATRISPGGYLMMDDMGFETVANAVKDFNPEAHNLVPIDLGPLGIKDPVHKRTHLGFVEKSRVWKQG